MAILFKTQFVNINEETYSLYNDNKFRIGSSYAVLFEILALELAGADSVHHNVHNNLPYPAGSYLTPDISVAIPFATHSITNFVSLIQNR